MKYKIIFAVMALFVLAACQPPCPPGTVLSEDGICVEEGAQEEAPQDMEEVKDELPQKEEPETEESQDTQESEEKSTDTQKNESITEAPEQEQTSTEQEASTEFEAVESSPEEAMSVMGRLKKQYETKVTGYRFDHEKGTYKIRGNVVKIELIEPHHKQNIKLPDNTTRQLVYYDTVYHDLNTGKTAGYCEGINSDLRRSCQKMEIEDVPISVDYSLFEIKMPHEWLYELNKNGTIQGAGEGKYYVDGRAVTRVAFSTPKAEAYFDPFSGLPLKIEIGDEGMVQVVTYKRLAVNDVKEAQMQHRTFTEVPFDEIAR